MSMTADEKQNFSRTSLVCPKCGSVWMEEREVREMFVSPYKNTRPLYSGGTKIRIYCGDCHALVWPVKEVESKEKPRAAEVR